MQIGAIVFLIYLVFPAMFAEDVSCKYILIMFRKIAQG